ncbi:class I SAM-dependent methyltransferase [Leptolyngbya sp. NIES-2104]|uniref:class I SAM-dependent methyltransferase n=1 Tax=Leptolyngbya sp. NIES-2104 TaxID=1552121 RepID=UPI0006ECB24D|nr:class I SAM-dependent methyltransferase [Leptolyngbya sp. NIES-2104]GAP95701.1 putative methyltransferase [Leptolyngbya sp. NIES-2104]
MERPREPLLEPLLRWLRLRRVIAEIPENAIVLDVGCGRSAAFLRAIEPQIQSGYGVDFKVAEFQTNKLKAIQVHLGEKLPFADASFEVVTMLAVLEHIEHEQAILKEIYRVLKPSGKLVLTVPSVWAQPVLEFLSYRLRIVDEAEIRDHKRYYDRQKLRQALIQVAGFERFRHQYFQMWMNNFCTVMKG